MFPFPGLLGDREGPPRPFMYRRAPARPGHTRWKEEGRLKPVHPWWVIDYARTLAMYVTLYPHKALSQTGYVFLCGGTTISWKSAKQTMVATSTNHSEIIALFEATKECVWLRRVIHHVQNTCGLNITPTPTIIYEDNSACVAQIQTGYVKTSLTKHISPKFFYMHELQKKEEIMVTLTKTNENLADLFTKSLPTSTFEKLVQGIGMRRIRDVHKSGGALPWHYLINTNLETKYIIPEEW